MLFIMSRDLQAVKLTGLDAYRLRIGSYRIAYAVRDGTLVILVVKVAHRSSIYKAIETIKKRAKGSSA